MNELVANLKKANVLASEVVKELQETQDPTVIQGLVHRLANDCYVIGVEEARKEVAAELLEKAKQLSAKRGL